MSRCRAWALCLVFAGNGDLSALEFRQNVAFSTGNQNVWAPGEAVDLTWTNNDLRANLDVQLPTVDFDPVKSALRAVDGLVGTGIADLLGVGVSVGGGISGEAGVEFGYHVNGGLFHMNYPGRSSLDVATYGATDAIASGRDNRVTTAFLPGLSAPIDPSRGIGSPLSVRGGGGYDVRDLPGAGFEVFETPSFGTQFPNASAWADLYVNANANAFMQVNALFDKLTIRTPGIQVNERLRLAEVNSSGIYIGGQEQIVGLEIPFGEPISIPGVGQVKLSYPDVTVTSGALDGAGVLRGSASKPIISLQAQLEKLVPVIGSVLSNDIGPFGYTIVETLGGPTVSLYQDVSFTPQPRVQLAFSRPVLHRQSDGTLLPTNIVDVALGESFDIQPLFGTSSTIDVQPTYFLNNTFTNEIGIAIGVDFDIDALKLETPVGDLGPALHVDLPLNDLVRIPVADFAFEMPMTPVHARRFALNTVNPTTLIDGASLTLQSSQFLSLDPTTGRETHRFVALDSSTGATYNFDATGEVLSILGAPELDVQFALKTDTDIIITDPQSGQPVANLGSHLCFSCDYDYSEFFEDPIDLVTPEGTLFVNPFFDFSSGIVDTSGDPLLNENNYFRTSSSVDPVLDPIITELATDHPGILFSNLAEPPKDQTPLGAGPDEYWAAQAFYTGDNSYALRSIRAMVAATSESPNVVAGLYALADGEFAIGELITTLKPQELTNDLTDIVFVPGDVVQLDANTSYWFVLGATEGSLVWSYEDTAAGMGHSTFGPGSLVLFADSTDAGANWTYYSLLDPYRIQINVADLSGLPGDYNNDGTVNIADYIVWRDHLGTAFAMLNDATPGVDADDYIRWKSQFGQTIGGSQASPLTSVPEPPTCAILPLTAILWGVIRVGRSRHLSRYGKGVSSQYTF